MNKQIICGLKKKFPQTLGNELQRELDPNTVLTIHYPSVSKDTKEFVQKNMHANAL